MTLDEFMNGSSLDQTTNNQNDLQSQQNNNAMTMDEFSGGDPSSVKAVTDVTQIPKPQPTVQEIQPDIISAQQSNPTFPAQGESENLLSAPLKTLGNLPSSAFNFVKGIASMYNPISLLKNIGQDISGLNQAAENFGGGKEGKNAALHSLISNLPGAAYHTLIPEGARKFLTAFTGIDVDPNTLRVTTNADKGLAKQQAIDAFINDPVGQVAPFLLAAKGVAEKMGVGPQFDTAMSKVAQPVETIASKPFEFAKNTATKIIPPAIRGVVTQLSGLNPETIQAISAHPEEFTPEKMLNVSRKGLAEEIETELSNRQADLQETGKGYEPIRQGQTILDKATEGQPEDYTYKALPGANTVTVDPNYVSDLIQKKTGVSIENEKIQTSGSASIRDASDIKALQNLYNTWSKTFAKGELTPSEFLNFRSDLADMSTFGRELTKSDPLENVAKDMRADLNSTYRSQIPNLEQLDTTYSQQIDEYKDLSKGLIKDGELTDSAINKIANAAGKGKDLLLEKLEEIKPGITQKIRYLKAVEDIEQTAGQKVGTYTKAAIGGGGLIAGIATVNIPLIAGSLAEMFFTQPENVVKIIKAYKESAQPMAKAVMEKLQAAGRDINQFKIPARLKKTVGLSIEDVSKNKSDVKLTTAILKDLPDEGVVSKQFIEDLTRQMGIKQAEKDIILKQLEGYGDKIDVADFKKDVQSELLPLKVEDAYNNGYKYEQISLPDELKGNVKDYKEKVYESPIKTSAGNTHFRGISKNYFGHTRVEDMADNTTRRVIEVQSDLYQKGNLEKEGYGGQRNFSKTSEKVASTRDAEIAKLQQYNDPTAHYRMVREEVRQAAIDGKTKLQFPTGETAMKIEGLGQDNQQNWIANDNNISDANLYRNASDYPKLKESDLRVGRQVFGQGDNWIITDVLGDGKFKAISKSLLKRYKPEEMVKLLEGKSEVSLEQSKEQFDISGKVDQNNPIYKFYQNELGKYLKNKFKAVPVTDKQGVQWWQLDVPKDAAHEPVDAFGLKNSKSNLS